jgi:hypothetical protein
MAALVREVHPFMESFQAPADLLRIEPPGPLLPVSARLDVAELAVEILRLAGRVGPVAQPVLNPVPDMLILLEEVRRRRWA